MPHLTESTPSRVERVRRWLDRLRPLRDPTHPLGQRAIKELPLATGLSASSVRWALDHAFEVDATDEDLQALVARVVRAPTAHVLLSANVFVSALRAIAIALASSPSVQVRPSVREGLSAELLYLADPTAFHLVSALCPSAGEHVWAYGADVTIAQLRKTLPQGVVLHGHGSGHGLLLVDAAPTLTPDDFDAMALDIAAFDQRGCLSPRFVLLEGDRSRGRQFARQLLAALDRVECRLPNGRLSPADLAAAARHRSIWQYLGEVYTSSGGTVTLDCDDHPWGEPPACRTVHVRLTDDALADLLDQAGAITAVGSRAWPSIGSAVSSRVPSVRWSPFGMMQCPRLDGPVDLRADPAGIVV